ncbi:hypothetical protein REPUB_Repub06bG0079500 [Reevesia pubescens]
MWFKNCCHIMLLCEDSVNWGPKPFYFFNYWMEMEGFGELVNSTWRSMRCPNYVSLSFPAKNIRPMSSWEAPLPGFLKFNVDGSTLEKPGDASIMVVICNEFGTCLLIFSRSIGIVDSNVAEFLVVKEAFSIFYFSKWAGLLGLIIQSDSTNAVKWFNCHVAISGRMEKFCPTIDSFKCVS